MRRREDYSNPPIIHIAPDISYLFPDTSTTARTYCNELVKDILAKGEFVGLCDNLNPECVPCIICLNLADIEREK